MEVVRFTPRPLYLQGKIPWYPLDRKLGGPQSLSGRGGEVKKSHLAGIEPRILHGPTSYCITLLIPEAREECRNKR